MTLVEVAAPDEAITRTCLLASKEGPHAPVHCQSLLPRSVRMAIDDGDGLPVVAHDHTEMLEVSVRLIRHIAADELDVRNRYSFGHHDRRVLAHGVHTDRLFSIEICHSSNPGPDVASWNVFAEPAEAKYI